jgi:hypothetical protein
MKTKSSPNELSASAKKRKIEASKQTPTKKNAPLPPLDYSQIYPTKRKENFELTQEIRIRSNR